jgi:hypothetical protein
MKNTVKTINIKIFIVCSVMALMLASGIASATTIAWKGLTWTMYGANTTAVVNGNGGLDITVLGGQSGDPEPDNWVLHSLLPANLTQANAPWVEFKIQDTYAGDASIGGPRGFVDTDINSWTTETMLQGGVLAGYSTYYLNHNVWKETGGWVANDWYKGPTRTAGEHTVKFGMRTDGNVDMWFDGVLGQTIAASPDETFFKRMYLGVDTASGTTFTATYNDLQWGTGYVAPEPGTLTLLGLAGLTALACVWRRRRR